MKKVGLLVLFVYLVSCSEKNQNLTMPDKLLGVEVQYTYTGGNEYAVKFEEAGASYQYKNGKKPNKWWGPFKYNHMMTGSNEHLVSWHEADKGDYVTLLINFQTNSLYGSAILKAHKVHFEKAEISKTLINE